MFVTRGVASGDGNVRKVAVLLAGLVGFAALTVTAAAAAPSLLETSRVGGPVVLMGIDAEDGGLGEHGPVSNYGSVTRSVLSKVRNGGSGLLVVGGGKKAGDDVTSFWTAVAREAGTSVSFVNGESAIAGRSLVGFAAVGVASSKAHTPKGGLTQKENDALAARRGDVAAFVNGGGGLIGLSQSALKNPYEYLAEIGSFSTNLDLRYDDVVPTDEGRAVGVTDALDVCCWHDEFTSYPQFLSVLATNADTGKPAALGGASVVVCPENGLRSLQGTPADGAASRTVHENVEPVAEQTGPDAGNSAHAVGCTVAAVEESVDDSDTPAARPQVPEWPPLPGVDEPVAEVPAVQIPAADAPGAQLPRVNAPDLPTPGAPVGGQNPPPSQGSPTQPQSPAGPAEASVGTADPGVGLPVTGAGIAAMVVVSLGLLATGATILGGLRLARVRA